MRALRIYTSCEIIVNDHLAHRRMEGCRMRKTLRAQAPKIAIENRQEARQKINAKTAILQQYAKKGTPSGAFVPRSLEQFRVWADEKLKLEIIGSNSTLYQPWNVDVRIEILKLIKSLTSPEKTSTARKNNTDRV